ncbi:MAG: hypothetical protein CM15mP121_2480 [Bacteroidota bacterium]|nr:MAG: hypothetical protein CM15mP121_2480 [Bacteroidota bacterium]
MFANTGVYGNLENWDVGNVTNMANMFLMQHGFGAEYPGKVKGKGFRGFGILAM